jgi:hypothetical protein
MVGGPYDGLDCGGGDCYGPTGAAWVFTRSGELWSEQVKLVGDVGPPSWMACQGNSVALSADGKTAISGGPADDEPRGAAFPWMLSPGGWNRLGGKLVGTAAGAPIGGQGTSVALSADGTTAIVGGVVAAFVYTAPPRVKLNVTTTPGSGVTGTTYVNIIGSGFPKGTVNPANVTVSLAASCGGPPLATTRATSVVPIMGTSDRVQFRIPGLAPGLYYVTISDVTVGDANFWSGSCSKLTVTGL